jgi:hypothetical protein
VFQSLDPWINRIEVDFYWKMDADITILYPKKYL